MADLTFGAHVTPIKDLDRAVEFYSELLGLTVKMKNETIAILDGGAAEVWLYDYGGALEPGGPTQLVFFVSGGIEEYEKRIRNAGCSFVEEMHTDPLGRCFIFLDSEGTAVEIRQLATS